MTTHHDVLVVGAGISGLLVAGFLRDLDVNVAVATQKMDPARVPTFLGLVNMADLSPVGLTVDELPGASSIETHRVVAGASVEDVPLAEPCVAVEHDVLLAALRARAEHRGAIFPPPVRAIALRYASGFVAGATLDGEDLAARLVILADEADPRIAESVGLRPDWPPHHLMHIAKVRVPRPSPATSVVAWSGSTSWGQPGWGMAIQTRDTLNLATAMTLEDAMRSARHISEMLAEFAGDPHVIGNEPVDVTDFRTEVVPIGGWRRVPTLAGDSVMMTGDLAGLTTPLLRDGLSLNVELARAVAQQAHAGLRDNDLSAAELSRYGERVERVVADRMAGKRDRSWLASDHARRFGWSAVSGAVTDDVESATLLGNVRRQRAGLLRTVRRVIGR